MQTESTDIRSEIERDAQAAAIPAGDILDNSSIRGYEVRHAAGPDGITDTWDPARPVEVVVVGGRYVTEKETFEEGSRISVPLGEILPANGRLQIAAEYDLAQEKARQLAPKISAAAQRRLAEEARQREQFEQSLTPEQQKTLETTRASWLAKQKKTQPPPAVVSPPAPAAAPAHPDLPARIALLDRRIKSLLYAAQHGQPGVEEDIDAAIKQVSAAKAVELQKERDALAAQLPPRVIPPPAPLPKSLVPASVQKSTVRERLQELQELMQEGLISPEIYNERQAQIVRDL